MLRNPQEAIKNAVFQTLIASPTFGTGAIMVFDRVPPNEEPPFIRLGDETTNESSRILCISEENFEYTLMIRSVTSFDPDQGGRRTANLNLDAALQPLTMAALNALMGAEFQLAGEPELDLIQTPPPVITAEAYAQEVFAIVRFHIKTI